MFARAKFMVEFIGAYRRSRKSGAGHDAALAAVTDHMFGRQPADLPEPVYEMWCDPAAYFELDGGRWFGDGGFEITESHLALLRSARLTWDGAERGAPMLDPERPYGRADLLAHLSERCGTDDAGALGRRHVEMFFVIARVLRRGDLQPGRYELQNLTPADVRTAMRGDDGLSDDDIGVDADGQVTVTPEHIRLLRSIETRWPPEYDCRDRLATGSFPAAAADAKRPYGDFTHIEVDMARILGELPPPPTDGPAVFEPSPQLAHRLQRLHWQMLATMQVFLERAHLTPGTYGLY